jgi:hypothetical protein
MIEISLYYLLGSIVGLPIISIYLTKCYYTSKIQELIEYYQDLIKVERELCLSLNNNDTFSKNKSIIEKFFESRIN